ncbi:MAG: hypothetical protein ACE5KZ_13745 [Candidatus Scalinduaceae bacterium]
MPITNTLVNARELEEAGIPKNQAEVIAKVIERAQYESQQDLKEFFRMELKSALAETKSDLLIKIFGIVAGCVTIAVTILKLFP